MTPLNQSVSVICRSLKHNIRLLLLLSSQHLPTVSLDYFSEPLGSAFRLFVQIRNPPGV